MAKGVWQELRCLAHLCQAVPDLRGEHVRERHQLRRLVRGVAKHVTLVAGANLLQRLGAQAVNALPDVWRLLLNVHQHLRRHTRLWTAYFQAAAAGYFGYTQLQWLCSSAKAGNQLLACSPAWYTVAINHPHVLVTSNMLLYRQ